MGKSTRVLAAVMSALLLVSGCSAGGKTQSEAAPKETAAATQAAKEPEAEKKRRQRRLRPRLLRSLIKMSGSM